MLNPEQVTWLQRYNHVSHLAAQAEIDGYALPIRWPVLAAFTLTRQQVAEHQARGVQGALARLEQEILDGRP